MLPEWYISVTQFGMTKKLKRQQVINIRKQYAKGEDIQDLAASYRVSRNSISRVVHLKTHRRVEDSPIPPLPTTPEQQARARKRIVGEALHRT